MVIKSTYLKRVAAFTLVELLVSVTILAFILMVATGVISQIQKTWMQGQGRVEQFRESRTAFEAITQSLQQATLNQYMTYKYNNGVTPTVPSVRGEAPTAYLRYSELQFITGQATTLLTGAGADKLLTQAVFFQAPLGISNRSGYETLNRLLCGRGYFLMYDDDSAYRPPHVTRSRTRFKLMEYRPPSEKNGVYTVSPGNWYTDALSQTITAAETLASPASTRPVAENIIALIISPRVAINDVTAGQKPTWIAPSYGYDSTVVPLGSAAGTQGTQHMLPPLLQVTLVAIDEASAVKLEEKYGSSKPPLIPNGAFMNADDYDDDLMAVEAMLKAEKLNYRVFNATVGLRNSKWNLL